MSSWELRYQSWSPSSHQKLGKEDYAPLSQRLPPLPQFFCHNGTTRCSWWQTTKSCTLNCAENGGSLSVLQLLWGHFYSLTWKKGWVELFPFQPSPALVPLCPLAKGPCWLCHFGAGFLANPIHRREISGTTWEIQRPLVEAADAIQIFIHLLYIEYKEEESAERRFLIPKKSQKSSLFPAGELRLAFSTWKTHLDPPVDV